MKFYCSNFSALLYFKTNMATFTNCRFLTRVSSLITSSVKIHTNLSKNITQSLLKSQIYSKSSLFHNVQNKNLNDTFTRLCSSDNTKEALKEEGEGEGGGTEDGASMARPIVDVETSIDYLKSDGYCGYSNIHNSEKINVIGLNIF